MPKKETEPVEPSEPSEIERMFPSEPELMPPPTAVPVSGPGHPPMPRPKRPQPGVVYEGGLPGMNIADDGRLEVPENMDNETARRQLRMARNLMAAAGRQLNQRGLRAQNASQVTPTMPRTPEQDADPNLYWTGTHYRRLS